MKVRPLLTVALSMPDVNSRWDNLWGKLVRAAELLGLTIAADNCGLGLEGVNQEVSHQEVCT